MKNTYKDKRKKHGNVYQMYCAKEGLSIGIISSTDPQLIATAWSLNVAMQILGVDISFCTRRIY